MFHDETMPSFFRRPSYSPDGSLLIVPGEVTMVWFFLLKWYSYMVDLLIFCKYKISNSKLNLGLNFRLVSRLVLFFFALIPDGVAGQVCWPQIIVVSIFRACSSFQLNVLRISPPYYLFSPNCSFRVFSLSFLFCKITTRPALLSVNEFYNIEFLLLFDSWSYWSWRSGGQHNLCLYTSVSE